MEKLQEISRFLCDLSYSINKYDSPKLPKIRHMICLSSPKTEESNMVFTCNVWASYDSLGGVAFPTVMFRYEVGKDVFDFTKKGGGLVAHLPNVDTFEIAKNHIISIFNIDRLFKKR